MGTHSPSSVLSVSPVRTASSCLSVPGTWGTQGCYRSKPFPGAGQHPKKSSTKQLGVRLSLRGRGGKGPPNLSPSPPSHLADVLHTLLAPGQNPVRVPLGTAHPPWGQKRWWELGSSVPSSA